MTFQSQINANAGGVVHIDPGIYNESVSVPANTTIIMPNVTLNAIGRSDAMHASAGGIRILGKANDSDPDSVKGRIINPNGPGISIANQHDLTFRHLYFENWYASNGKLNQSMAAIQLSRSGKYAIEYCEMRGARPTKCNCIWVKRDTTATLGPCRIAYNAVSGGYDGIGSEVETSDQGGFAPSTVIECNVVRDCHDDGIQVEGRGEEVYVYNNDVAGCGIGIALAAIRVGPAYVRYNNIHDGKLGTNTNVLGFKIGAAGSGLITMEYNVVDQRNSPNFSVTQGIQQTNSGLQPMIFKHNKMYVGRYVIELIYNALPVGSEFDFNQYYAEFGSNENRFKYNGAAMKTLAEWQALSNQDANSEYTASMF